MRIPCVTMGRAALNSGGLPAVSCGNVGGMCRSFYLKCLYFYGLIVLSSLGSAGLAQSRASTQAQNACDIEAEAFLSKKLSLWQKRLNLEDWKISIVMSRAGDLRPGSQGNIRWDTDKKSAVIRVLRCAEYKAASAERLDDMEFTVVHELIHLEFASLPRSEASRRVEEHAVNRIAQALLLLDRGKQPQSEGRSQP